MSETVHRPDGILPAQTIRALINDGAISGTHEMGADGKPLVQPASLDLSLGDRAYRLKASFLPGLGRSVAEALEPLTLHEIDLRQGAVLETGCIYLVPLAESLNLPKGLKGLTNPKSSTGRLDVFTRVICDGAQLFDHVSAGYSGPLFVEIAPRTFPILVRPGDRLVQLRLAQGTPEMLDTLTVSIDLEGEDGRVVGYRARRHAGLVNLVNVGGHDPQDYWEPLYAPRGELILDPDEFYILASRESVSVPADQAAEMAPIAPEIGEFRAHYAGFFDPGFGLDGPARAVLEVRGRDVPFLLRHGQSVAKLVYSPMTTRPDQLYGAMGSHYQSQGLRLSKHFAT